LLIPFYILLIHCNITIKRKQRQEKDTIFTKKTRKIWSGVFTPSGEVDFTLNRGGIRQGMLQGGPPRDDPSPILIGKIH
jgi:hypothetical protein